MSEEGSKAAGEAGAGTDAEIKTYSEADFNAKLAEHTSGLKAKVDELLGEKKTVSQKAKEAEEKRDQERTQQAKESSDYKSLYESSEGKRAELQESLSARDKADEMTMLTGAANKLANEMSSGHNVHHMERAILERLGSGEDRKLMVLSEDGKPTVGTLAELKKEFVASGRFDSLIDATKASGGGAAKPNTGGAGGVKTKLSDMTRSEKLAFYANKKLTA